MDAQLNAAFRDTQLPAAARSISRKMFYIWFRYSKFTWLSLLVCVYLTCCSELVRLPLTDGVTGMSLPSPDDIPLSLINTYTIKVARNGCLVLQSLRLDDTNALSYAIDLFPGSREGVDELLSYFEVLMARNAGGPGGT